jgi:FKBP-type peptidyl-prolyl cis-trans isomerase
MKFTSKISAALASLGLLVAASAQDPVKFSVPGVTAPTTQPGTPAAAPAGPKFTEAQIAEAYGWYMGAQMGLRELEFSKADVEAMTRGMMNMVSGAQPTFDPKEMGPEVKAFLAKKQEAYTAKQEAFMTKLRAQNAIDNAAFFAKLKENKNVVELPSGVRYEILKPATGAVAKPGQVATIHYTGTLVSGQVFDSSIQRGQPIDLPIVEATPTNPNGIIAGMFEGLQKVGVGGKAKLYIPPALAYGDAGNEAIPPGAALIFEVEVIGVKDAPAPAAK